MVEAVDPSAWGAVPATSAPATDPSDWGATPVTAPVSVGGITKAAGVGVAKGAIGLAGMPGDIRNLLLQGVEGLHGLVVDHFPGIEPERAAELKKNLHSAIDLTVNGVKDGEKVANFSRAPTSPEIQGAVEQKTGEFRKPGNMAEEFAQTGGEFLPAAMAGPGGIARKVLFNDVVPAALSEGAGQATKGNVLLEPVARIAGGVGGGLLGALGSRAATAERAIRGQMPEYVTPTVINQADHLISDAANRGVTLTWPEAMSQVTGRPVLTDMQRILESSPSSRATMQNTLADRPHQVEGAVRSELDNVAPQAQNPAMIGADVSKAAGSTLNDVRGAINTASQPFYKAAEGVILTPQEMAQARAIPGFAEAANAVRSDPQLNRYVSHLPDNSSGFLNEVKKQLDQSAENASSTFAQNKNMQRSAGFGQDAKAASSIAENAVNDTGRNYTTALAVQSYAREKYLDPLLAGPLGKIADKPETKSAINALFPSNPLPNSHGEISTAVSALAKRNPMAATQLVRAHAESVFNEAARNLQGGANQFSGAKFAKELVGNPQQRANLQAAVQALPNGSARWNGFERLLDVMQATGTRQPRGSMTAFNEMELRGLQSGSLPAEFAKTGASPGKWMSLVHDKWSKFQMGSNLDELARIITDPRAAPMLERVSRMPTNSQQAGLMVSRILLQNSSAAEKSTKPAGQ